MDRIGKAWDFFQDRIIENLSRYVLLAMIGLAFLEVIRRYIFGATFLWSTDVLIYFHLAAVFLYFGLAEKQKVHIRLDLFLNWLERRWRRLGKILAILPTLISLLFCVFFVWFGIEFVKVGIDFGRKMENAELPLWPFYVVLLLGFTFIGAEFGRSLYRQITKREKVGS